MNELVAMMLRCPRCNKDLTPPSMFCSECKAMGMQIKKERIVRKDYDGLRTDLSRSKNKKESVTLAQERKDLVREFGAVLGPDVIDGITYRQFLRFVKYINNRCAHHDMPIDLTEENFEQVRNNLKYFLYGSDPIEDRVDAVMVAGPLKDHPLKIEGFQRSGSLLLNLIDPERCIWNDRSQDVLFNYHQLERIDDPWKMYEQNQKVQTRLARDLNVDLFYLDFLIKKLI